MEATVLTPDNPDWKDRLVTDYKVKGKTVTPELVRSEIGWYTEDGDFEGMHNHEDGLYASILLAIAQGNCSDPAECARLALETKRVGFPRYAS